MTSLFAPNRWVLHFAGIRVPEFRCPASDAELAFGPDRLAVRVCDEIAFCAGPAPVDPAQWVSGNWRELLKIGFYARFGQDLRQRLSPDDFSFSSLLFQDAFAIARSPKLASQFIQLSIAARIIRQAGGFGGPRSHDSCAGLNKFFDLAEEPGSHEFRRRENQQTVAHAIWQDEPAILHRHASEHDLWRGHITVVAWRQRRF